MKTRRIKGSNFSGTEAAIINVIRRNSRITIAEITKKIYGRNIPPTGAQVVATSIRRIQKKCDYYHLNWTLGGEGFGRNGKTIWEEKR